MSYQIVWPGGSKRLTTRESVDKFLTKMAKRFKGYTQVMLTDLSKSGSLEYVDLDKYREKSNPSVSKWISCTAVRINSNGSVSIRK